MMKPDRSPREALDQSSKVAALAVGAIFVGGFLGGMLYLVAGAPQAASQQASQTVTSGWLQDGQTSPVRNVRSTPAPRRPGTPLPHPARRMPKVTMLSADRVDVPLYDGDIAPAVVTEFLLNCPDCQSHFRYFPKLVPAIREAREKVVNLAFQGTPGGITKFFGDGQRDFGGQVFIDKGGALQRHFGIGTFTVWLLDEDGTIRFQGSPYEAETLLGAHLMRRAAQRAERRNSQN